jgi:thioredoxin
MPVLVNPKACVDREHCFAAAACPYDAFYHNSLKRTWEVDATICGDCPGPCLNFCDKDALRWGDDLVDLKLVKAELEGTMTPAQVAEARLKHKKELQEVAAREESAEGVIALTRANFEREVLRAQVPVVVDCWADWCGPCKQFSPVFEATAKQYVGVVKFAKLDTDAEPALATGLGVRALPTVLMFYKGQLANAIEGALPAEQFQVWIYQTLTAIRQYESQFEAEAVGAVDAAAQNVAALNREDGHEAPGAPSPSTAQSPSGLVVGHESAPPPAGPRSSDSQRQPPGKQTPSGLYIP